MVTTWAVLKAEVVLESLFLTAASRGLCRGPAGGCLLGWCSGWALRHQRTWGVWRSMQLPGEWFMAMSTRNQQLSLRDAASRSPRLHGSSPRAGIVSPTEGPWTSTSSWKTLLLGAAINLLYRKRSNCREVQGHTDQIPDLNAEEILLCRSSSSIHPARDPVGP